jgi:uncharacterized protein (DUF1330 family)
MTAYVLSEVAIRDEESAARYRLRAEVSIAKYGGRYLVRGGLIDVAEGDWPAQQRVVVVEFPSMQRAREWYASPEYAEALAVRRDALERRLIFVEGVAAG